MVCDSVGFVPTYNKLCVPGIFKMYTGGRGGLIYDENVNVDILSVQISDPRLIRDTICIA